MREFSRLAGVLVVTILLAGCGTAEQTVDFPEEGTVRIVRDTWGVPHIYGSSDTDVAYGLGWAMAEDRLQQIFSSKMTALGRLAELTGERGLDSDVAMRSFQIYEKAAELESRMKPANKAYIQSFCNAINDYISAHRDALPAWIDTYTVTDVVAQGVMINLYFPLSRLQSELRALSRELNGNDQRGSNQFAVSGDLSAKGNAMLSIDPHLPFEGPLVWAEAHIVTPENSIVGNVVPGAPAIVMGHNGHIAWANTNNYPDTQDLYAFPLADEEGRTYQSHDGVKEFERIEAQFTVKTDDGSTTVDRTLLISHVGPVMKVADGTAYVGRIDGYYAGDIFAQFLEKAKATTIEEYAEAMKQQPGMIMWNQMLADTGGNIAYFWNALVPQRNPELDWSGVVPGDDPRSNYSEFVPFEELPRAINPDAGWLQNCNDSPWHVNNSGAISEDALEDWMYYTTRFGFRGKRITELLSADDSVTFEEMKAYAQDTKVLEAAIWVPRLIQAYEQFEAEMDLAGSTTEKAVDVLRGWDLSSTADATGMALFHHWIISSGMRQYTSDPDAASDDVMRKQMLTLAETATELREQFGAIDVPWGSVLYFQHGERTYAMGGGGYTESMKTLWGPRLQEKDGRMRASAGSSYRMIVEMSETPRAISSFPMSMNSDPESPHFYDITELYVDGAYKPVPFSWEEVLRHARYDVTFQLGQPESSYVEIDQQTDED